MWYGECDDTATAAEADKSSFATSNTSGCQRLQDCSKHLLFERDEIKALAAQHLEDKLGSQQCNSLPPDVYQAFLGLVCDLLVEEDDRASDAGAAVGAKVRADYGPDFVEGQPVALATSHGQAWDYPLSRDEKLLRIHQLWDLECVAAEAENRNSQQKLTRLSLGACSTAASVDDNESGAVALEETMESSAAELEQLSLGRRLSLGGRRSLGGRLSLGRRGSLAGGTAASVDMCGSRVAAADRWENRAAFAEKAPESSVADMVQLAHDNGNESRAAAAEEAAGSSVVDMEQPTHDNKNETRAAAAKEAAGSSVVDMEQSTHENKNETRVTAAEEAAGPNVADMEQPPHEKDNESRAATTAEVSGLGVTDAPIHRRWGRGSASSAAGAGPSVAKASPKKKSSPQKTPLAVEDSYFGRYSSVFEELFTWRTSTPDEEKNWAQQQQSRKLGTLALTAS